MRSLQQRFEGHPESLANPVTRDRGAKKERHREYFLSYYTDSKTKSAETFCGVEGVETGLSATRRRVTATGCNATLFGLNPR